MKNILLTLVLTVFTNILFAQKDDAEPVYFKVTNYNYNGEEQTGLALRENIVLAFYDCDLADVMCMSLFWRASDSQSYGGVYGLKKQEYEETAETYAADFYTFTWDYVNSYNEEKGQAKVTFQKIYVGRTIKFTCDILVLEDNSTIALKGYMEQ